MTTKEVIDAIFKDPNTQYQLSEFDNLGKPIEKILYIYPKEITSGKDAGKVKYFLKSFAPFASGTEELQRILKTCLLKITGRSAGFYPIKTAPAGRLSLPGRE